MVLTQDREHVRHLSSLIPAVRVAGFPALLGPDKPPI